MPGTNGTWNNFLSNGNWSLDTNWVGSIIADGAGGTANFVGNIGAARTVTLDTSRTIGNLTFQDTLSTFFAWTLGGAQTLTLDNEGPAPVINVITESFLSTPLAGSTGLTKTGSGLLHLYTYNNTGLSGPVIVNGGTLEANISGAEQPIAQGDNPSTASGIAGASSLSVTSGVAYINNANLTMSYPISISAGAVVFAGGFNRTGTYLQDITGEITGAGEIRMWCFGSNFNRPIINKLRTNSLPASLRMMTYSGTGDYRPAYYYYNGSGNSSTVDLIVDLNQTTSMENPTTTMYVHNVSPTNGTLQFRNVTKSASASDGLGDLITLNIGVVGAASGVTDTGDVIITGVISEAPSNAALSIRKDGTRKLTLGGANTYTGTTTISGGTLSAQSNAALGSSASGGVTVSTGATLEITGGKNLNKGTQSFALAGHVTTPTLTSPTGENSIACSGISLNTASAIIDVSAGSSLALNNTGAISGVGFGLTKKGTGVLSLAATSNTYTGVVNIDEGTLAVSTLNNINTNGVLGNSSTAIVLKGTLRYIGTGTSSTNRSLTLSGATPTLDASGTGTVTYSVASQQNFAKTITFTGTGTGENTASFNIGNTSFSTAVTKSGVGKWVLSGATLNYTGATAISGGTLNLGSINRSLSGGASISDGLLENGTSTVDTNITMTGGTISAILTGTGKTLSAVSGAGVITPAAANGSNSFTGTSTISAGATLKLISSATPSTSGNGKVLGDSNVTVNGTIETGYSLAQRGQLRVGGNLTMGNGSVIRIGAAA